MHEFKDKDGGRWQIDLTIGTVMRVKAESDKRFNLFEPQEKVDGVTLLDLLTDDLAAFWEFIWYVVRPQAEAKQIDATKFGDLMAADCLLIAQASFMEEWRDFFQQLQRPEKALALEKTKNYREKARALLAAKLNDPTIAAMDARVASKTEEAANAWLGNLRESLDKTLGPTPSASYGS